MSLTKRYLESLPEAEQNAILGRIDPDYEEYWAAREAEQPMNELEKLIADSIAARDAKIAETEAARIAEEARYTALFHSILNKTIEEVKKRVPAPLHPYIKYTGGQPPNRHALESGLWSPNNLHIQAPGLAEISITFGDVYLPSGEEAVAVTGIAVAGKGFDSTEWAEAICAAHDHYWNQRADYSKAARGLD